MSLFMRCRWKTGALAVATLLVAISPSLANKEKPGGRISLTGVGEISVRPDIARVTGGVISQAKTAAKALAANSTAMARIINALKAGDIVARDIQTSGFSVNPTFYYDQKNRQSPPKIIGYQVQNQIKITVRQRGNLGPVLDRMVTLGANRINSISFLIDKPKALRDDARKLAVKDALRKAKIYTAATNSKLGRIISISEGSSPQPVPRFAERAVALRAPAAVPIEAGEQRVSVQVNITWELE